MRALLPLTLVGLAACTGAGHSSPSVAAAPPATAVHSPIPDAATRLLVVRSTSWDATSGRLVRYERTPGGWVQVGSQINVVLGGNGMGWGRGLHGDGAPSAMGGPAKREGDRRSPAGAFSLG